LDKSDEIMSNWFELNQVTPYLYVIRERLDFIEPRFLTKYTNMYLVLGEHSALLFDTGSGLGSLRDLISPIIGDRELNVLNSHNHFDHIGGNDQFEETQIHRLDFKKLMSPMSVKFLEDANPPHLDYFKNNNFQITFSQSTVPLTGDELFDLGDIEAQVLFTPGHTPGSICLQLSSGEIFTGDTLHYGAIFLPDNDQIHDYEQSMEELGDIIKENPKTLIYPGHESYKVEQKLYSDFISEYSKLDWTRSLNNQFLQAEILERENFTFVRPNS
jgi:glyoxylase-like metal-dependent hydrolase (beta-lactamase superfamily II)